MIELKNITSLQLRQAADIKEEIAALENQLNNLKGSPALSAKAPKKGMSAAGRAAVAAAQKARWAKLKAGKPIVVKVAKKKGGMSAAGRARIAAAAKARWAKVKASGKNKL